MVTERYYIIVAHEYDYKEFETKYVCMTRTGYIFLSDDKYLAQMFYNEYKCREMADRLKREFDNVHVMTERIEITID